MDMNDVGIQNTEQKMLNTMRFQCILYLVPRILKKSNKTETQQTDRIQQVLAGFTTFYNNSSGFIEGATGIMK